MMIAVSAGGSVLSGTASAGTHRRRRRLPLALNRIGSHPSGEALLKPTVLAAVTVMLVDRAIHVATTLVTQILPNGSLEKAFASLARYYAVVTAGSLVLCE